MAKALPIDILETFAAVVQHDGDAGQAARALDVEQPTMSKRLAHLQYPGEIIKRPWLSRDGKVWLLTDEGRRVLPAVKSLLRDHRSLYEYSELNSFDTYEFRFACGQTAAVNVVRETFTEFHKRKTDARIRISTMRSPQRIAAVASGAVDLAMVNRDEDEIQQSARGVRLHSEVIGQEIFCLICGKNNQWSSKFEKLPKRKPLDLEVLRKFPIIVPESDSHTRGLLDPRIYAQSWAGEVDYAVQVGGWQTILKYVQDGHGVAIVDELALSKKTTKLLQPRRMNDKVLPSRDVKIISRWSQDAPDNRDIPDVARLWIKLLANRIENWAR
jgi:DNA-binding transcriptional LysR family regulator